MRKKIIFIRGLIETLGYFSEQIAAKMKEDGYAIFFLDANCMWEEQHDLEAFCEKENTVLITFNCIGISGETLFQGMDHQSIWEKYAVSVLNILVDHPLYYCKTLEMIEHGYTDEAGVSHPAISDYASYQQFCIDEDHVDYMQRYYPDIKTAFLPLAGNICETEIVQMPMAKREHSVVFAANYVPKSNLEKHLEGLTKEYREFYFSMIEELLRHRDRSLESVVEEAFRREMPELTKSEIPQAYSAMAIVDLYVRTSVREEVVRTLVDQGTDLFLIGKDWDLLDYKHPENLQTTGKMTDSATCVKAMAGAKIALNVMPWFKRGIHDRVLTGMLQGCVSVTDPSEYLRANFTEEKELIFYDLHQIERLPQQIECLLSKEEQLESIAQAGYQKAVRCHTWAKRAEELEKYL